MREAWNVWKKAVSLMWEHLIRLVVLNLIWVVVSIPLVTVGPATLALYWWVTTGVREDRPGNRDIQYTAYFKAFGRLFFKGLVWSVLWVLVLGLAWTNLQVWPRLVPAFVAALIEVVWLYFLLFFVAMQPYLLEHLAVDELRWGESLKRSAWHVLANPLYSHMHLAWPVAVVIIASKTHTVFPLILVALLMLVWSVIAGERPRRFGELPPLGGRLEDVL
jgi:uncharacterized membrane protein YesL